MSKKNSAAMKRVEAIIINANKFNFSARLEMGKLAKFSVCFDRVFEVSIPMVVVDVYIWLWYIYIYIYIYGVVCFIRLFVFLALFIELIGLFVTNFMCVGS